MAATTKNLACTKGAFTNYDAPNTNTVLSRSTNYEISGNGMLLLYKQLWMGFEAWPSSLARKRIYSARVRVYTRPGNESMTIRLCDGSFTQSAVTYNNKPNTDVSDDYGVTVSGLSDYATATPASWATEWINLYNDSDTATVKSAKACSFLNWLGLYAYTTTNPTTDAYKRYLRGGLSDNSAIYVEISYDSAEDVKSQVTRYSYPSGTVDLREAQSFSWTLERAGDYHSYNESWSQASATLYYRKQGTSDWSSIAASGSTMSATIPANTLSPGMTYEWYISCTDNAGTTTTTDTLTFTTDHSTITPGTKPTGTIDANTAKTFTWTFPSSAGGSAYSQQSAALKWRVSGESSWNTISASGTTQSLTVPANTFPTGETIEWYLTGTDSSGYTSSSSQASFATASTAITPRSYPSGSSVDNRLAQSFTWDFVSTTGGTGYNQQSASFYWRVSGETNYRSIAASGSTKSVSVPAYTFPADSTIEWYVSGTDAGGTTTSSSVRSFTTQAYSLALGTYPSGNNVDPRSEILFNWTLNNSSGAVAQASATLYWRVSGGSAYTAITNSTSVKSIGAPANTFPTGKAIQWYVSVTASDGSDLTSNVQSFTTVTPKLSVTTYPSGNKVDFASALRWAWTITSTVGEHEQQSATLYWRVSTLDDWTGISASDGSKTLTVPANTFPSGQTVQWYLSVTDIGGTVMTCNTQSFTTVTPQITPQDCPTSGYADPRNAITFSWYFSTGGSSFGQQSAALHWRVEGETAWNTVNADGSTQNVTIAANTFPLLSVIEWYLSGTDIGGTSSQTEVYSFNTTASTTYAVCKEPVGRAEDGTKPITLKWIVQNADGSAATRTNVAWKTPSESQSQWHTILDTVLEVTETTVLADTFPAGPIEWRVTAYNRDNVAGPASQASFVCITAPDAPTGLTATAVPFTEIHWQAEGQEAYEIQIDGEVVTYGFSSAVYAWTAQEPLPDGVHTISVRIQGAYGLWSNEATTTVLIENEPDGEITVYGSFDTDAVLRWEFDGSGEASVIAIYRDGKWIGTATGRDEFSDRYVLGPHEYVVEYRFATGFYTRSDPIVGDVVSDGLKIAAFDGGEWIELRLSENDMRVFEFHFSRTNALQHITASKYPIQELSPYEDVSGSFDCAFSDKIAAREFERLYGKTVILKTESSEVLIGGLTDMQKRIGPFYTTYAFTVQQIQYEDVVNHDAHH